MHARYITALTFCSLVLADTAAAQSNQNVNDGHGQEWRQLTDTVAVSWTQVAQICPTDGISPCSGRLGGIDVTGWTWANQSQVRELFGYYEPAMLTNPGVSGSPYFFTASNFLGSFRPTFSSFLTYSTAIFASGWTASTDLTGQPIIASVSAGTTPVSISGSFGLGPVTDPAAVSNNRGAFLRRSTGLATNSVVANDDAGQVASPAGGVAVPNVLTNDWVIGIPATIANSRLSLESSSDPGVTLDLADGSVDVAPGTAPGTYSLIYKLCDAANPSNCDGAAVRVTVPPYVVKAVNDLGSASPSSGGVAIANVLANDTLGAAPATVANVFLTQLSSTTTGVTLSTGNGAVVVARGTAIGTQSLLYKVCEIANPTNCDIATATVTVQPYIIDAVDDSARTSSKTGGTAIPNVLSNDRLGPFAASTALVRLTQLSPAIPGITLSLTTGAVTIAPKTTSGLYSLIYKICEINSPTNCDQATVALDLSGK